MLTDFLVLIHLRLTWAIEVLEVILPDMRIMLARVLYAIINEDWGFSLPLILITTLITTSKLDRFCRCSQSVSFAFYFGHPAEKSGVTL